jgi:hypothetical protein
MNLKEYTAQVGTHTFTKVPPCDGFTPQTSSRELKVPDSPKQLEVAMEFSGSKFISPYLNEAMVVASVPLPTPPLLTVDKPSWIANDDESR